ncbi:LysE family transporter [Streptomyces mutabilis]
MASWLWSAVEGPSAPTILSGSSPRPSPTAHWNASEFVLRSLAHDRLTALASVLGNALGGYALVIAVAMGVGALVETSVVVFPTIKLAGAAYLVYLGVRALRASWASRRDAVS